MGGDHVIAATCETVQLLAAVLVPLSSLIVALTAFMTLMLRNTSKKLHNIDDKIEKLNGG